MKKAISLLLALIMVFALAACGGTKAPEPTPEPTPAPTKEPTPIEALTSKEKLLFDALIKITKEDFFEPSKIRVLEVGDYTTFSGPHTIVVRLQGENKVGGTLNHYYKVVLKDGEREMDDFTQSIYNLAVIEGNRYKAIDYKGKFGDYGEMPDYTSIESDASSTFNIGRINKAIAFYWEDLGIN